MLSLRTRLVAAVVLALTVTLGSTVLWVHLQLLLEARDREYAALVARTEPVARQLSDHYASHGGWDEVLPLLDQASALAGLSLVLMDERGHRVAEAHPPNDTGVLGPGQRRTVNVRLIDSQGREMGRLSSAFGEEAGGPVTSPVSRFSWILLGAGLVTGTGGAVLAFLITRYAFTPLYRITFSFKRLANGDLTSRVPVDGWRETSELAHAFNALAERLEGTEKQRGQLIAQISHELRRPLTNFHGYSEMLREEFQDLAGRVQKTIDDIQRQVDSLSRNVEDLDLLEFAAAKAMYLNLEPTDLEDLAGSVLHGYEARARASNIALVFDGTGNLPLIQIDRRRITQVLENLLENALAHTEQGGTISVSVEPDGAGRATVHVSDTGEGIPPDTLPHIFESGYRAPSLVRPAGGSGMGLAIARQLIEAHGGAISASSDLGEGTRFSISLPLATTLHGSGGNAPKM